MENIEEMEKQYKKKWNLKKYQGLEKEELQWNGLNQGKRQFHWIGLNWTKY